VNGHINSTLELRDIHLPPKPPLWPPALGWWVASVLVVIALVFLVRYVLRATRLRRRRRVVLSELAELQQRFACQGDPSALAEQLSILLRRVALARYPREQVAGLQGGAWLHFLDETGGDGRFSKGPGKVLASAPYVPHAKLDPGPLLALAQDWIRRNCRP
jgi:hypothetical protein